MTPEEQRQLADGLNEYRDFMTLKLDKAYARIAQLEEALKIINTLDYARSAINHCAYKAHTISKDVLLISSDTWLSQHDKAIEVNTATKEAKELT